MPLGWGLYIFYPEKRWWSKCISFEVRDLCLNPASDMHVALGISVSSSVKGGKNMGIDLKRLWWRLNQALHMKVRDSAWHTLSSHWMIPFEGFLPWGKCGHHGMLHEVFVFSQDRGPEPRTLLRWHCWHIGSNSVFSAASAWVAQEPRVGRVDPYFWEKTESTEWFSSHLRSIAEQEVKLTPSSVVKFPFPLQAEPHEQA